MKIVGSYREDGYAHLQRLVDPSMCRTLLRSVMKDLGKTAFPLTGKDAIPGVIGRPTFHIHGDKYAPLRFFLAGLTPLLEELTGVELLPTFALLRIYRADDLCRVHSDKEDCEHGLSLTLEYSDDLPWPLEIGMVNLPGRQKRVTEGFEGEDHATIAMSPGDAVLYRGIHRRHGRTQPNPNRWSAHLFLFWVERDGAYHEQGAAKIDDASPVNFG
jgi:hypothetical protein